MVKIVALLGITLLYGLLFHGFMRLALFVLGPPQIDMVYVGVSAVLAAAISTAIWMWRAKSVRPVQGWVVGGLAIALVMVNVLISRGLDGLIAAVSARPLHSLLTYLIVFAAVPACVHAALRLQRAANGRR